MPSNAPVPSIEHPGQRCVAIVGNRVDLAEKKIVRSLSRLIPVDHLRLSLSLPPLPLSLSLASLFLGPLSGFPLSLASPLSLWLLFSLSLASLLDSTCFSLHLSSRPPPLPQGLGPLYGQPFGSIRAPDLSLAMKPAPDCGNRHH